MADLMFVNARMIVVRNGRDYNYDVASFELRGVIGSYSRIDERSRVDYRREATIDVYDRPELYSLLSVLPHDVTLLMSDQTLVTITVHTCEARYESSSRGGLRVHLRGIVQATIDPSVTTPIVNQSAGFDENEYEQRLVEIEQRTNRTPNRTEENVYQQISFKASMSAADLADRKLYCDVRAANSTRRRAKWRRYPWMEDGYDDHD